MELFTFAKSYLFRAQYLFSGCALFIILSSQSFANGQLEPIIHKCKAKSVSPSLEGHNIRIPPSFMWNKTIGVFRLQEQELMCKLGQFEVLLNSLTYNKTDNTPSTTLTMFNYVGESQKDDEDNGGLTPSGYLRLGFEYFHPAEYCISQISTKELSAFVCKPQCDETRPCIQKCCGLGQSWDIAQQTCVGNSNMNNSLATFWEPVLYSQVRNNCVLKVDFNERQLINPHIKQGVPICFPKKLHVFSRLRIKNVITERYRILKNGTVISKKHHGGWNVIRPLYFCVDSIQSTEYNTPQSNPGADQVVLACEGEFLIKIPKKAIPFRYVAILLVASGFLAITAIVFLLLWDKHNIYNWTIFCEVVAMLFMIAFVGIAHSFAREPESDDYGSTLCVYIGATSHFFYLSTFFWLTMINFDLYFSFRNLKPNRTKTTGWVRFIVYQFFGWGIPLVIVVIGIILDGFFGIQNDDVDCTNVIVPNYGQLNCYLSKEAQGPYLFYPIGVLLGGNLIFFVMTIASVQRHRKGTEAVIKGRSTNTTKPLAVFAKLFIVMGVAWILEIFAWAFHSKLSQSSSKVPWYWIIFDVVNLVQAIAIFFMFVWKRQLLSQLCNKYPSLKPLLTPLTRLPCCGQISQGTQLTVRKNTIAHNRQSSIII